MTVVLALEGRFARTPDGAVWAESSFDRAFWQRYLNAFEQVSVMARVQRVSVASAAAKMASGDGIEFLDLPCFVGPLDFVRQRGEVLKIVRNAVDEADAVILRVPGTIGSMLHRVIHGGGGRPFGVEVVGDPHDVFAPGAISHPLRGFFRSWFAASLRRQCAAACAAAYVTKRSIQRRYPPASDAFVTCYSSVDLGPDAFAIEPRRYSRTEGPKRLVFVGSLEQMYKGPHILIEALHDCNRHGHACSLAMLGDGRCRPAVETSARELGLTDRIFFAGHVRSGEAVRQFLDGADLFVLPSLTEGLPRAMIEAMARGLPCIGSRVGGIPELLEESEMFEAGNVAQLVDLLISVTADPGRMTRLSASNLIKAREFRCEILSQRRTEFYSEVRTRTEAWLSRLRSATAGGKAHHVLVRG